MRVPGRPLLATEPETSPSPLLRLGSWSYRRRRLVVAAWLACLILTAMVGRAAGSQFKDSITGGKTESAAAADFLHSRLPSRSGDVVQVVFSTATPVRSRDSRARIVATLARLATLPHVAAVTGPFDPGGARQISPEGRIAYGTVMFDAAGDAIPHAAVQAVVERARAEAKRGFDVELGGTPIQNVERPHFGKSEAAGLLGAMVVLLLAFGSLMAMALPIAIALVAVAITFGLLDLLSHALLVPSFGPELAALVGLAVGIDYALFIVTRYRRYLRVGATPEEAVAASMPTSGRAVVFAGATVVLSLLGLFILGLPFIYGAALGTIAVVVLVMAASVTLLPAALGFVGAGIDRLHVGRRVVDSDAGLSGGFWLGWSRKVQARPLVTGGAALVTLATLAIPLFSLRLAFTDAGTAPSSYTSRQAFDLLARGFGPGVNGPLVVALQLPRGADRTAVAALRTQLATATGVASVSPAAFSSTGAGVVTVIPRTSPQDPATAALVTRLRDNVIPRAVGQSHVQALLGGETAASIDTSRLISRHLGLVLAFVIVLSVLLLTVAFRSVLIPVASAAVTLLSTGVSYGVVVAVFQWGWLGSGIDGGGTAPVDPWVPVMLFTIIFGLSMDYQVFLVSRVREAWRAGSDPSAAVTSGLASTGRVITSAAAIMVCVFGAFVLGDLRVLRLFGLGMAVAVLLDATLVRMVLMPAILQVSGRSAWWFPRWLERSIPDWPGDVRHPPALIPVPVRVPSR